MHWFLDPIKNHYADFSGRATRQQFWMFVLIWFLISILFSILNQVSAIFGLIHFLISLAILVPALAIGARRLHDTGKSGWWQLIGIIPLIGLIAVIILMIIKGESGTNDYGPSPYGAGAGPVQAANDMNAESAPAAETPAPEAAASEAPTEENKQQGFGG